MNSALCIDFYVRQRLSFRIDFYLRQRGHVGYFINNLYNLTCEMLDF
jgi:hypothetical protein